MTWNEKYLGEGRDPHFCRFCYVLALHTQLPEASLHHFQKPVCEVWSKSHFFLNLSLRVTLVC